MKCKKAMLFSISMVLIFVIVSISAFILLDKKYRELSANRKIGEKQLELVNAYSQGEKAMFYIDRAAELAAEEALYDLAESGSLVAAPCGTSGSSNIEGGANDYVVWQLDDKKCFSLEKAKEAFESYFNARMRSYLSEYPERNVRMPASFEISLTGSLDITGTAATDLVIGLSGEDLSAVGGDCGQRIVEVARRELAKNVVEERLGCNCGAAVEAYTAGRHEAWCADFVSYVYKEAGYAFDNAGYGYGQDWQIPSAQRTRDYFAEKELFVAKDSGTPQPGDAIAFDWNCDGSIGHVGIVESFDGKIITTIEGNWNNRVGRVNRNIESCEIAGFGRLKNCVGSAALTPGLGGKIIALDAGHGATGGDCPAGSPGEAKKNQNVALELKKLLEEAGATVVLTRTADCSRGSEANLKTRADKAKQAGANVLVDIHHDCTSSGGQGCLGTKAFVYCPCDGAHGSECSWNGPNCDTSSINLANIMHSKMTGIGITPGRTKGKNLYLLKYTSQYGIPATLVEVSNVDDPKAEPKKVAKAMFEGLSEYFEK